MKRATEIRNRNFSLILGILYLILGIMQFLVSLCNYVGIQSVFFHFFQSDSVITVALLLPAVVLFAYIITRLYRESSRVWLVVSISIGYILLGVVWYLILYLLSDYGIVAAVYAYTSLGLCILLPLIFVISGLLRRTSWMPLASVMILNWMYLLMFFFSYGMADGEIAIAAYCGVLFTIPLLLLVVADLLHQYRLASTRKALPKNA